MVADLFARARAMHQSSQPGPVTGPAAPAAPKPPGVSMAQPTTDFHTMAKKFGIAKLKLDPNPVIARTQLMAHLQTKLGPNYMKHPGVSDLLSAFNNQSTGPSTSDLNAMTSQGARTAQTLMGG